MLFCHCTHSSLYTYFNILNCSFGWPWRLLNTRAMHLSKVLNQQGVLLSYIKWEKGAFLIRTDFTLYMKGDDLQRDSFNGALGNPYSWKTPEPGKQALVLLLQGSFRKQQGLECHGELEVRCEGWLSFILRLVPPAEALAAEQREGEPSLQRKPSIIAHCLQISRKLDDGVRGLCLNSAEMP